MTLPAAVLFDCDGVIVDTETVLFEQLGEDLASHGLVLTRSEIEHLFHGGTIWRAAETARAMGAELPEGWGRSFYNRLYARLAEGTALIPGILEVFERLDAAGVPYAVGSNGEMRKMEITLGQHPALWTRLEGCIFSGQSLGQVKPDPGLYLHAAKALGIRPEAATVIEDSPNGARAARTAGMRCLGYAATSDAHALAAEGAEVFIDMADLPARLGL